MKTQVQKTSFGDRKSWRKKTNQRPISYNWFNQYICGLSQNDRRPQSSQALGNKLNEAKTNLRQAGIIIERLENKANHSKHVILIKQDVGGWEPETIIRKFPGKFPVCKWPNSH